MKALAYVIRIIPAIIIFFQNCVCLDYLWSEKVQYVQDEQDSSSKDKKSLECYWEGKQGNFV